MTSLPLAALDEPPWSGRFTGLSWVNANKDRGVKMVEKLSDAERVAGLRDLKDWTYAATDGAISREFRFKDFSAAFGFMSRVALAAEKAGHHPDWSNSYNVVKVQLSTHDAGGLSAKDIALARAIDAIAG